MHRRFCWSCGNRTDQDLQGPIYDPNFVRTSLSSSHLCHRRFTVVGETPDTVIGVYRRCHSVAATMGVSAGCLIRKKGR
ncbi:hypothetical protein Hanom_Chr00s007707g01738571 [Helianthus anomalus]